MKADLKRATEQKKFLKHLKGGAVWFLILKKELNGENIKSF